MEAREFEFDDRDFDRVRELIREHAGISLHPGKRQMVYSRLARRLRANSLRSFSDYLDGLSEEADEWQHFVNALTTNLTAFFREAHHFPVLAEHLQQHARRRTAVLWCSACSTGEEAYSMAITAVRALGTFSPAVRILATDVDTNVLAVAAEGVYPLERVAQLPRSELQQFFLRGKGSREGFVRVRPELREMILFRPLNLLADGWPIRGPLDAIFCRNVMIYFDKPTQYHILSRFAPLLRPEGLLFAGHSESFSHASDLFRPRGRTIYMRAKPA